MKIHLKLPLALLLFILGFSSCSDEFTRADAEKILKSEYSYPYIEFDRINIKAMTKDGPNYVSYSRNMLTNEQPTSIKSLIDLGLITPQNYRYRTGSMVAPYATGTTYRLSSLGESFLQPNTSIELSKSGGEMKAKLPICKRELVEVTGIRFLNEGGTQAEVEFLTTRTQFTPFAFLSQMVLDTVYRHTKQFNKYDDGWRLDGDVGQYIGESSFSQFEDILNLKGRGETIEELAEVVRTNLSMADEESPCLIKSLTQQGKTLTMTVDFIQLKWAVVGGIEEVEIINQNPKLRTFIIDNQTEFGYGLEGGIEQLKEKSGQNNNPDKIWEITVSGGYVIELSEKYFP